MNELSDDGRGAYAYLPADELMAGAGYQHTHVGRFLHRGQDGKRLVLFFSGAGKCVLQHVATTRGAEWRVVAAEHVATDEQLLQLLREHQFPAPAGPGL